MIDLLVLVFAAFTAAFSPGPTSPPDFRVPGEFEPVSDLVLVWEPTFENFVHDIAVKAAGTTRVNILSSPEFSEEAGAAVDEIRIATGQPIRHFSVPNDSIWIRDYGPVFLLGKSRRVALDPRYPRKKDDRAFSRLAKRHFDWPTKRVALELEGGNFLANGRGVCITADERQAAYRTFRRDFHCQTVIVLPALAGEPTGHVDMYVHLTGPRTALVGQFDSQEDFENATLTDQATFLLQSQGFRVSRIPMPTPDDGHFRTHANALVVNDLVFVPVYPERRKSEAQAIAAFEKAYPHRIVVPIVASDLVEYEGSIHCASLTIPIWHRSLAKL